MPEINFTEALALGTLTGAFLAFADTLYLMLRTEYLDWRMWRRIDRMRRNDSKHSHKRQR